MTTPTPPSPDLEPLPRNQVLIAMGATGAILLGITKLWQALGHIQLMSLIWVPIQALYGVALALGMVLASAAVYRLWPEYRRCADEYLRMALQNLKWPDLIWLGLIPGLSEELLFRGLMLPAFGLNGLGLVISSLLFGAVHLSSLRNWPYLLWAMIMGAVLGGGAIASHNLLVPVVAHILTNWISSSLWKWENRSEQQA
jgi:uncharacterized protein